MAVVHLRFLKVGHGAPEIIHGSGLSSSPEWALTSTTGEWVLDVAILFLGKKILKCDLVDCALSGVFQT